MDRRRAQSNVNMALVAASVAIGSFALAFVVAILYIA